MARRPREIETQADPVTTSTGAEVNITNPANAEARLDTLAPAAIDVVELKDRLANAEARLDTLTRALNCLLDPQSHLSARTQTLQDARAILAG